MATTSLVGEGCPAAGITRTLEKAQVPSILAGQQNAASCGFLQNEGRTRRKKWHKSDTGGSPSVPAAGSPETETAVPAGPRNGADVSKKLEDIASPFYGNSHNDAINRAALWLHQHRSEITGRIIPALKKRFGLKNLAAIEAAKRARVFDYGGGR